MHIRKLFTTIEETYSEGDFEAEVPLRKVAAVAVVKNPFAKKHQHDMQELHDASISVGNRIAELARAAMEPFEVQSYGKVGKGFGV